MILNSRRRFRKRGDGGRLLFEFLYEQSRQNTLEQA